MTITLKDLRLVKQVPYRISPRGARGMTVGVNPATGLERKDKVYQYATASGDVLLTRRKLRKERVDGRAGKV